MPLSKLFRWLLAAVELRDEDVLARKDHKAKLKEERKVAIEAAEERDQRREQELSLAQAEFEAKEDERLAGIEDDEEEGGEDNEERKRRLFDMEAHLRKWDEENPRIEIPEEIVDDVDNDYDLEERPVNEL